MKDVRLDLVFEQVITKTIIKSGNKFILTSL